MDTLSGFRVAVLATDGFEEAELTEPVKALQKAGAEVTIVSLKSGDIQGFQHEHHPGRHQERRWQVGQPGGRRGQELGHQQAAGRHPGLQPGDAQVVRRQPGRRRAVASRRSERIRVALLDPGG